MPTAVEAAAKAYEIPSWTTDWRTLVDDPTIDIIDICTPPGTHAEIAMAAAAAGKAILCEKPLTATYADAASAADAVTSAGVLNAVGFNYRRLPALALMQQMIQDGVVGDVLLWRANWMSDEFADPTIPFDWRFDPAMGGTTIADLGCHLFDMALWMVGDVDRVSAQSSTFTRERSTPEGPRAVTGRRGVVGTSPFQLRRGGNPRSRQNRGAETLRYDRRGQRHTRNIGVRLCPTQRTALRLR